VAAVVKYAAERCIQVVPEVELPGHCCAALAAYPNLSCEYGCEPIWFSTRALCVRVCACVSFQGSAAQLWLPIPVMLVTM
jgi:hypothetical protein